MTADTPRSEPIATGDRREDMHFDPDPDQLVRARFTEHATEPLPPEEHSAQSDSGAPLEEGSPVEDVRVAPDTPSVWDARPVDKPGEP